MRKIAVIILLVGAGLVCVAAVEQVSVAKFTALSTRVSILGKQIKVVERKNRLIEPRIKTLERELTAIKNALKDHEIEKRIAADSTEFTPQDLQAWKLARKAAEDYQKRIYIPGRLSGRTGGRAEFGRAAQWVPGYSPPKLHIGEPSGKCMRKTSMGDYVFAFPRGVKKNGTISVEDVLYVSIIDYETELRVGNVGPTNPLK